MGVAHGCKNLDSNQFKAIKGQNWATTQSKIDKIIYLFI